MSEPTNADLQKLFADHTRDDGIFQDEQRETNATVEKSLAAIHERLGHIPTRDEEAEIVAEVIRGLLLKNGKLAFHGIVATSVLIGALVVIFGGFKTVLAWIGFAYVK